MTPTNDEIRARLKRWEQTAKSQRAKAEQQGSLRRQEWWELEYQEAPYLCAASEQFLAKRYKDHFHNMLRLNAEGKIGPVPHAEDSEELLTPLFCHLRLEYEARGFGIPLDVAGAANQELRKYFKDGVAKGVRLFKGYPDSISGVVVKFSQKKWLQDMLRFGKLRLTPAHSYADTKLEKAMQDIETEREFYVSVIGNHLRGDTKIEVHGIEAKIEDGFIGIVKQCPNYLLWSACTDIDRRLADDFNSDAAIIIHNPQLFEQRLDAALRKKMGSVPTWRGPVRYYDPCSNAAHADRPETLKHFAYLYQREWRYCAFPNEMPEEPLELEVGSLEDIATLVQMP